MNLQEIATLQVPDGPTLSAAPQRALTMAKSFTIATADDYTLAAEELQAVKSKSKALEEKRTSLVGPLNGVVKSINDLFRAPLAALAEAESVLKGSMLGYSREQERIAAEARRKAEAEAAAERARLAAEAAAIAAAERERQRVADEQARQAFEAGNAAQAAEVLRASEEAAQAAAQTAATLEAAASTVTAAAIVSATVKVKGISQAKSMDFEVNDLHAFIRHVAQHPELVGMLKTDDMKIRQYVKSLGDACKLPGIRVYEKVTLRA